MPHRDSRRAEHFLQALFEVPLGPWPAAEQIQARRTVLGERVTSQMRLGQQRHPVTPPAPGNLCHAGSATGEAPLRSMIREKTRARLRHVRSAAAITAVSLDDPLTAAGEFSRIDYCCAPHSGQNFARFGIDLPHSTQNFVSPAGAAGSEAGDAGAVLDFVAKDRQADPAASRSSSAAPS